MIIRTFFGTSTYVLSEKRRDFFQKNDVFGEVKVFTKRGVFVKKNYGSWIERNRILNLILYTLSGAFSILKHQQAIIYDKELITSESVKKMNELYNLFKIKCPETIPYSPTADELKRL